LSLKLIETDPKSGIGNISPWVQLQP